MKKIVAISYQSKSGLIFTSKTKAQLDEKRWKCKHDDRITRHPPHKVIGRDAVACPSTERLCRKCGRFSVTVHPPSNTLASLEGAPLKYFGWSQ